MAAGLVGDFGAQVNQNGGLCSIDPMELAGSGVVGGLLGVGAREANSSVKIEMRGGHLRVGSDFRVALYGNTPGSREGPGRWTHYHRRVVDPATGETVFGQGIGRHRPWETRPGEPFWRRF